jgi:hypothetical protein
LVRERSIALKEESCRPMQPNKIMENRERCKAIKEIEIPALKDLEQVLYSKQ